MDKIPLDEQDRVRIEKDIDLCDKYLEECEVAIKAGVPIGTLKQRFEKARKANQALLKSYFKKGVLD